MPVRPRSPAPIIIALLLTLGVVAGCSTTPQPDATPAPAANAPELTWRPCPDDVENTENGPARMQCATVSAPLDYDDPDGRRIDLTISRLASANPEQRRGILLLNPGGPGGTGLNQPTFLADLGLPQGVLDSYDVIGMDTRGVGHSSPVSCGFTNDQNYGGNIPPYAVDDAAVTAQAQRSKDIAAQCAANDHDGILPHVTTANMARDLDFIRAALGEDTASFLGYSYGSGLGAAYTSLFPDHTDRVVLDSNLGDTHLDRDGLRRYALGMEQTFPDFAAWVAARDAEYHLGATEEDVRQTYLRLADQLDRNPVDEVDGAMFRLSTFVALYNPISYAATAEAWVSYLRGGSDASARPATAPGLSPHDNAWTVFLAVTCNDFSWPTDVDVYREAVAEDRDRYPLFGAASANVFACAFWPREDAEPPVPVGTSGPANVLIVQNQRDPVTPLRGGQLMNDKFDNRSRLLTIDGSGHGGYVLGTNPCAQEVVTEYLVDGTMPEQDMVCEAPRAE
ncbi:alpha/beta hydrolase [Gordonia sp. LSe1-13]|uniref:Alpha/beta hydrolase n=1 Tax=Gordonia sesuvii TaxID=3116777 RepID=A0ABU7MF89_9ACTN|nr:alpha/beta hydrolase [Gordonia sp. LSe1-13]